MSKNRRVYTTETGQTEHYFDPPADDIDPRKDDVDAIIDAGLACAPDRSTVDLDDYVPDSEKVQMLLIRLHIFPGTPEPTTQKAGS